MLVRETLYGGQLTLSTQLIKHNHLIIPPTGPAIQFGNFGKLWKLITFIHLFFTELFPLSEKLTHAACLVTLANAPLKIRESMKAQFS